MLGASAKIVEGQMVIEGDIGLSHYPIFDESYRSILNGKIVRRYWNQEIGVETPDMFKFNLETDMAEQMPFFNQFYKSERLEFDPFSTVDLKTFTTAKRNQDSDTATESSTTSDNTAQSRAVNSSTPQTLLARNKDYATAGADSSSWAQSESGGLESGSATVAEEGETDSATKGYQGLTSEMLMRFRDTFMNLDVMVIDSLALNFMLLQDSGSRYTDSYTRERYGI